MSAYDDYLIRQGQPDEAEDDPDAQIQDGARAARNLRWLIEHDGEVLPKERSAA